MGNRGEMTGTEMVVINRFVRQSACEAHCYQDPVDRSCPLVFRPWRVSWKKTVYIAISYNLEPHSVNMGVRVIHERYDTVWHTNIYHPKKQSNKHKARKL